MSDNRNDRPHTLSGEILKILQNRGLKQRQIAQMLGVSASEVSKVKAGSREWTTSQLVAIAGHLKLRLGTLLLVALDGAEGNYELDRKFDDFLSQVIAEVRATLMANDGYTHKDAA